MEGTFHGTYSCDRCGSHFEATDRYEYYRALQAHREECRIFDKEAWMFLALLAFMAIILLAAAL